MYALISIALGIVVASIVAARLYFTLAMGRVISAPDLRARLWAVFEPFEGRAVSEDTLQELRCQAARVFEDALTGVGLTSGDWRLEVHRDDVLGPVPRIHGPGGKILDVTEFQERVRKREIVLPSG